MKGPAKLIDALNELLADELTAIMQYMVHAEMCANWGYARLHAAVTGRARQEMGHAEKLIERILFLEGLPQVSKLNKVNIGANVPKQLANDLTAEQRAWQMYNAAIELADELKDAPTRSLLEENVRVEDAHIDWLEAQLDQIKQVGAELYMAGQVRE